MTGFEKLKFTLLPSLLFIGIGVLVVQHPHPVTSIDGGYAGLGKGGFIFFIILILARLSFMLLWNTFGGTILILLGVLIIAYSLLPDDKKADKAEEEINSSISTTHSRLSSFALKSGKAYVQRKLRKL